MAVLVTGGAGYIGSHMAYALIDRGERVVVLDNLSTGVRGLVPREAEMVEGDVADQALVRGLVDKHGIDSVIHFAGSIVVPDSVAEPLRYYANNTVASRALIEATVAAKLKHFIFSSTATVYSEAAALRRRAQGTDQPVRAVEADDGVDSGGRRAGARLWLRRAALLQRRRCRPEGAHRAIHTQGHASH
jgi:UDP-glucose 4-epimerase